MAKILFMAKIVWCPQKSFWGTGTVTLEPPMEPLTLDCYRGALAGRIDRMVRAAGPQRAAEHLSEIVEAAEGLKCAAHPETAGEVLAWNSKILAERSGLRAEEWPIPAAKIKPNPHLRIEPIDDESLQWYLLFLYFDIPRNGS